MPSAPMAGSLSKVLPIDASIPAQSTPEDFSLMRGGPLFRLLNRVRIDRPERPLFDVEERLVLAWLVSWLPLFIISLVLKQSEAFLSDRRLQAETLFALPVLLAGENYVNGRVASAAHRPLLLELLLPEDLTRYRQSLLFAARRRDSRLAELIIIAVAYALTLVEYRVGKLPALALHDGRLTPIGLWYVVIGHPVYLFLLMRWGWRFLIWAGVLVHLSKLDLQLVPTHADKAGGLRYLALCQASFSVVVFAVGVVIEAATGGGELTLTTEGLMKYAASQVTFAIVALIVVNLPLLSFCRKMLIAKRDGDRRFSVLMAQHARAFERKWFGSHPGESPLGSEDMSTQTDITSAWAQANQMWWVPFALRSTAAVLCAGLLLPLLPGLMMERQLVDALLLILPKG